MSLADLASLKLKGHRPRYDDTPPLLKDAVFGYVPSEVEVARAMRSVRRARRAAVENCCNVVNLGSEARKCCSVMDLGGRRRESVYCRQFWGVDGAKMLHCCEF